MKRFLYTILAVLMLTVPVAAAQAEAAETTEPEEVIIPITSVEELLKIQEDLEGHYSLEADLNLNDITWMPLPFSGIFEGNGHTIYNLYIRVPGIIPTDPDKPQIIDRRNSMDGENRSYSTAYAGLFSVLENAEIRDLHIMGADVALESDENCFAAILAGYMKDSVISGCSVNGRVDMRSVKQMNGIGGLVGFGSGTIEGCKADVELSFRDVRGRGRGGEQYLGGLMANGNANLIDNQVTVRGWDYARSEVHCGGLIGMFYTYDRQRPGKITGNQVSGSLTYMEDQGDMQGDCDGLIGDEKSMPTLLKDNEAQVECDRQNFPNSKLYPNACEDAQYEDSLVEPTCTEWGYVLHSCTTCDYTYKTDFVMPTHTPGDWTVVTEPTLTEPGLEQLICSKCGGVMEEREIPKLPTVSKCEISDGLNLKYKESATLTPEIEPADAPDKTVTWSSSNEEVATVDANGVVTATGRGEALITCKSNDGGAESHCFVQVEFTAGQWLIMVLLFGWLWY